MTNSHPRRPRLYPAQHPRHSYRLRIWLHGRRILPRLFRRLCSRTTGIKLFTQRSLDIGKLAVCEGRYCRGQAFSIRYQCWCLRQ